MTKKGGVRRVYGRIRRRSGRAAVPLLGLAAGGALGLGVMARGNGQWGYAGSPMGYLSEGKWAEGAAAAGKNLTDAGTYMPMILPLGVMVVMRLLKIRGKLTKRVSIA